LLSQTTIDTSTTPVIASGGNYDLLQMDNGFGAFLAAPEPMTDTYPSSATHSEIGQPITQEAVLQAAEMGDYATVLDFASQNTSQYDFDSIAAMPDERGYFERIGSELRGSVVVDQPLGERIENAAVAAYSGDPNNKLDGIESRVLVAKGWGRSLVDGLQGLSQDPFSIIRDPAILGYDQIQTAFYYGTDSLLGDPNSVARNQERSESLYNFVEAAKTSTNDPEMAGYLFGGAILGLKKGNLPGLNGRLKPIIGSDGQRIPFGFKNEADFREFSRSLRQGLPEGVEPVFKGSSVTGVKAVSSKGIPAGTPFDVGRKSDFDIGLISEDLTTQASLIEGARIKTGPTRIGPIGVDSDLAKQLQLNDLLIQLERQAGRKVEFTLFDSHKGGFKGETILVPTE
jgi:hypothetical protein